MADNALAPAPKRPRLEAALVEATAASVERPRLLPHGAQTVHVGRCFTKRADPRDCTSLLLVITEGFGISSVAVVLAPDGGPARVRGADRVAIRG